MALTKESVTLYGQEKGIYPIESMLFINDYAMIKIYADEYMDRSYL